MDLAAVIIIVSLAVLTIVAVLHFLQVRAVEKARLEFDRDQYAQQSLERMPVLPSALLQGDEPVTVDVEKLGPRNEFGNFERIPKLHEVLRAANYHKPIYPHFNDDPNVGSENDA